MSRNADRQVAVLHSLGSGSVGGSALGTLFAGLVLTSETILTHRTHLAVSAHTQLVTILAVWSTLVSTDRLGGPRGQTYRTQLTPDTEKYFFNSTINSIMNSPELALLWLITSKLAGWTPGLHLIILVTSGTLLLAVQSLGGAH